MAAVAERGGEVDDDVVGDDVDYGGIGVGCCWLYSKMMTDVVQNF